jgi:hypothetical protein
MWLSPRERHPVPDPPRLWPATATALAVFLGAQLFLALMWLIDHRSRLRTGRPWRPAGWLERVLGQVFLAIVLGGMLAWCSGLGAVGTATEWRPGHVTGVECPESGCVGRFVPDDGSPPQTVDVPHRTDGSRRAWTYGGVTFDPPPDPFVFLLLPLAAVLLFDAWWLWEHLRDRRRTARGEAAGPDR